MRWKEIFIGATVALIVTVIGGLLVYFFTQDKDESSIEELTYKVDKQVSFDGSDNQVSIGSLKFANIGTEPARNISADFSSNAAEILDFKITNEGGADISKTISKDGRAVSLDIKSLLPGEVVSITYLLSKKDNVEFKMRSEKTIGKTGEIYRVEKSRSSILNDFFGDFIPLLILPMGIALFFSFKLLRSSIAISRGSSKNNTGFVLMHTGQSGEAIKLFKSAIDDGQDGSHALANYSGALALEGDLTKARKYIKAAKFLARTKHERAICEMNEAIIEYEVGGSQKSKSSLMKALELSKEEIDIYLDGSTVLQNMLNENPDLKSLVGN